MKQFFKNIVAWQNTYAQQDLIPCPDGTYADPAIGCVETPGGVVSSESSAVELILQIASILMSVVAGIAAIMLIVGGITYALSAGDDEKMQKAKRIMFWSIFGLVVALIARFLAQFVLNAIM
jgi:hypothetical protein